MAPRGLVCGTYQNYLIRGAAGAQPEQGKKVCKVTAVRCAFLFLFAGIAGKQYSEMVTTTTRSYIGQLLTAADRCKKYSQFIVPWTLEQLFKSFCIWLDQLCE